MFFVLLYICDIINAYFYVRRAKVTSVFSILCLFQTHSMFYLVVMGANSKRCSRTPNEIIASKGELPVETLNIRILMYSVLLHYIIMVHLYVYI